MISETQNSNSNNNEEKTKPHPVDQYVGREIKKQRIIRGMSQNQLASKLGITFQQVQKYEKGTNRIVISRLYELTKVLGIGVMDVISKLQVNINQNISDNNEISNNILKDNNESFIPEFNNDNTIDSKEILMLVRAYICIRNDKIRNVVYNLVKSLSAENNEEKDIQL
ncbi:helix-turn-helix transcriptional regulator [Neoehrlichia mikurensis]|uniref:Helix-turn-helix domain-containing protein n=1 Tax=Neoehrlichia mikurensis TaxID=89586 RepID=A0A9Q9C1K7_9RICK|nr:helix-turn-helix transcriptional regulator [Neoehrlichia mikurensis]QXK91599.1 helix-turn-helix transcriptional regulator [Neoehrlichia mikurensis]QXK92810.1 helix-turn-helix transcriptional regulator [Neoehrlichia mikurensis]QXK93289.1 helix-turn-helix transcriptional regulator [Neoehrlichia mikurensis]UTO55769.1 helix-turn-helix domain-containing protein [Neoehrlichia mikurensis]UTO56686.1 helix-turn-helix domain-containing protein [Neoehrlichia mikurensis]